VSEAKHLNDHGFFRRNAPCGRDSLPQQEADSLNRSPRVIGLAGPVDLRPLAGRFPGHTLPATVSFPLIGALAEHLARRGYIVSLFASSNSIDRPYMAEGDGVRLFVAPLRPRRAVYDFYSAERKILTKAMASSGCDLIHANWTYEFAAAALDAGIPTLVTAHDSPLAIFRYFVLSRFAPFWLFRLLLGVQVVRRASHLTAVSPYCADSIRKTLRPRASIAVVPNGVSAEMIAMGADRLANQPPSVPLRIATVLEGFQARKNPQTMLRAFRLIRNTDPSTELSMFGTGYEDGGPADYWAAARGLKEGVTFHGRVPNDNLIPMLRDGTNLLVHPSREESFGMAPLEAMALGIPVVGGKDSGGVPYVLADGEAGVLVDVANPAAIAAAVLSLGSDPTRMRALARAAWSRAKSVFGMDIMVDAYISQYQAVLDGDGQRALRG
jgi:L-malate glycosyltransferase